MEIIEELAKRFERRAIEIHQARAGIYEDEPMRTCMFLVYQGIADELRAYSIDAASGGVTRHE
jgi:hypothetical protein